MPTTASEAIERFANREYEAGFVTDIESETIPPAMRKAFSRTRLTCHQS